MIITCPTEVYISSRKKFILNLNNYRNTHPQILNKAKIEFKRIVAPQIKNMLKMDRVNVCLTLYRNDHRKCDTSNICSIVEKFLMDAIVEHKKLPDDNYNHVAKSIYMFGGVEKGMARIEAQIDEIGVTK